MSLISNNNECNEEDKEYKRSMYERQREIEKLNEEKSKKKNKFSELKNYNSNSILSLDHSRSMNPKKRMSVKDKASKIKDIKALKDRNRLRGDRSFSHNRSMNNSLENSIDRNPIYDKLEKEKEKLAV